MLSSLYIENIAVIKSTEINFSSGFNVLTGETGAGKSILVDSIGLILGDKPQKELIRNGENRAVVSAVFTDTDEPLSRYEDCDITPDEDGCLYLTRTVDTDGKAQTKLNGRTVPVSVQKELVSYLINIHGQNDNRLLMSPAAHLEYLDNYAGNSELLSEYGQVYEKMVSCRKSIEQLRCDEKEKARKVELLKYQVSDIDAAKLKNGEEEELDAKRDKLKNSEKILRHARLITKALYRSEKSLPAYELVKKSQTALEAIADYVPESEQYIEKLKNIAYDLEEIGLAVSDIADEDGDDPDTELDKIESRLDLIGKLKRKYGSDVAEILEYRDKCAKELKEIEISDQKISDLSHELKILEDKAYKLSDKLSKIRKKSAETLEKNVIDELSYLEMPKVRFKVDISVNEDVGGKKLFTKSGTDKVEFLLSANMGEPLKPLAKIASGGELSRIMLALRSVSAADIRGETLIFDEIDVGVSGKTSQKIGIRLRKLAVNNQVICVTHAAQIAVEANTHFLIKKSEVDGRVQTTVTPLDRDGRINEIARIMGGVNITDKLLESAAEMLDFAEKNRIQIEGKE